MSRSNPFDGAEISRRTLLKTGAGAGAATIGVGALDGTKYDPVGEADAIAPVVVAGVVAGGAVLSWAVGEYTERALEDPDPGLSGSAAKEQIRNIARTRKSTNKSTFIDNKNIIDAGVSDAAYGEGKLGAIQAINNGKSQTNVVADAKNAINSYEETVIKNFLKTWNESKREAYSLMNTAQSHSNIVENFVHPNYEFGPTSNINLNQSTTTYTFTNGNTFTIERIAADVEDPNNPLFPLAWDPTNADNYGDSLRIGVDSGTVQYMRYTEWSNLLTKLEAAFQSARTNIGTWVANVYDQVASGNLDTADLLTAQERAAISTDNSEVSKALSDLMSLNIAADVGSEIVINPGTVDAEIAGSLGSTGETTFTAGTTVDPTADTNSYYFTYDVSQASGTWADYQTTVDGGTITFTAQPYEQTDFEITTNKSETVVVAGSDFTDNGDGTFSYDATADLENTIAEITDVTFSSGVSTTQYETVQLRQPFNVVSIKDDTGAEQTETTVTQPEPHTDTNYITQEEWDAREQRVNELIAEYEEAQKDPIATTGAFDFSSANLPSGVVLAGAAALGAYLLGK